MLRMKNFALDVSFQLDKETPKPTTTILDTGAGPSVAREDVLPGGWQCMAARAPKSTHVCDASGQLLKARGLVEMDILVGGKAMLFEFLAVKALSVPLILGMGFQKDHVKAIYLGSESVLWSAGMLIHAKRSWEDKTKEPMPVKGNPVRQYSFALYLSHGVTLALRSVQATFVRCGTSGR